MNSNTANGHKFQEGGRNVWKKVLSKLSLSSGGEGMQDISSRAGHIRRLDSACDCRIGATRVYHKSLFLNRGGDERGL